MILKKIHIALLFMALAGTYFPEIQAQNAKKPDACQELQKRIYGVEKNLCRTTEKEILNIVNNIIDSEYPLTCVA